MLKIGLTQRVESFESRGRHDAIEQAWAQLLHASHFLPVPLPNRGSPAERFISELGLNGIILTGGNDLAYLDEARNIAPERDQFEKDAIAACASRKLPLLGVCRGMQILLSNDGIVLDRVEGHAGESHEVSAENAAPWPWKKRVVNSFHRFGCKAESIRPPWRLLATAEDGTVEAVRHLSLPFWGVMWHLERAPVSDDNPDLLRMIFGRKRP